MGIETNPQSVDDLNSNWPAAGEPVVEGAAHLRNIKAAVKARATTSGVVGVTTLSNAIDSDSETEAATSKAVKTVAESLGTTSEELDQKIADFEEAVNEALNNLTFDSSKNTTGYVTLPNGIIYQWGKVSLPPLEKTTVTFPKEFKTACFNVQTSSVPNSIYINDSRKRMQNIACPMPPTRLNVDIWNMRAGDDTSGTQQVIDCFWYAVGV